MPSSRRGCDIPSANRGEPGGLDVTSIMKDCVTTPLSALTTSEATVRATAMFRFDPLIENKDPGVLVNVNV